MSEAEIVDFEEHVDRQLRRPSNVSLIPDQTDAVMDIHGDIFQPVGRLSVELYSQAVHDGQLGGGSSWTQTRMVHQTLGEQHVSQQRHCRGLLLDKDCSVCRSIDSQMICSQIDGLKGLS